MSHILIVDDEPFILRSLAFVLRKEGYDVDTASDGEAGLEKLSQNNYDVTFLDIMMPKMGGFEVLEKVKTLDPPIDTKIVFLSAKGMEEDREHGLALGACEFVSKPFSPAAVVQLLKSLVSTP